MIKLSDGRELSADLMKITALEYRSLFDDKQEAGEGDRIVGKAFGLTGEEVSSLPYPEYRRLMQDFFKAAKEPLSDPNSPSASSST